MGRRRLRRRDRRRERLVGTVPATTVGALAYIGHLTGWHCFGGSVSIEREDFLAAMATLHTFVAKEAAT